MKATALSLLTALALALGSSAASAGCFADYKAKRDNPLRLHYGVAEVSGPCDRGAAQEELSARLRAAGWTLLNVLSVFGDEGLAQRRDSAGSYYLRF